MSPRPRGRPRCTAAPHHASGRGTRLPPALRHRSSRMRCRRPHSARQRTRAQRWESEAACTAPGAPRRPQGSQPKPRIHFWRKVMPVLKDTWMGRHSPPQTRSTVAAAVARHGVAAVRPWQLRRALGAPNWESGRAPAAESPKASAGLWDAVSEEAARRSHTGELAGFIAGVLPRGTAFGTVEEVHSGPRGRLARHALRGLLKNPDQCGAPQAAAVMAAGACLSCDALVWDAAHLPHWKDWVSKISGNAVSQLLWAVALACPAEPAAGGASTSVAAEQLPKAWHLCIERCGALREAGLLAPSAAARIIGAFGILRLPAAAADAAGLTGDDWWLRPCPPFPPLEPRDLCAALWGLLEMEVLNDKDYHGLRDSALTVLQRTGWTGCVGGDVARALWVIATSGVPVAPASGCPYAMAAEHFAARKGPDDRPRPQLAAAALRALAHAERLARRTAQHSGSSPRVLALWRITTSICASDTAALAGQWFSDAAVCAAAGPPPCAADAEVLLQAARDFLIRCGMSDVQPRKLLAFCAVLADRLPPPRRKEALQPLIQGAVEEALACFDGRRQSRWTGGSDTFAALITAHDVSQEKVCAQLEEALAATEASFWNTCSAQALERAAGSAVAVRLRTAAAASLVAAMAAKCDELDDDQLSHAVAHAERLGCWVPPELARQVARRGIPTVRIAAMAAGSAISASDGCASGEPEQVVLQCATEEAARRPEEVDPLSALYASMVAGLPADEPPAAPGESEAPVRGSTAATPPVRPVRRLAVIENWIEREDQAAGRPPPLPDYESEEVREFTPWGLVAAGLAD
eukprot:TRINITY_DN18254_c0_g1_i1.p1 TRINITY_DN18254_c0_g1~~TRINITY_DN18254_c0_g1_i1.p1  ORF type:complete len:835 (+),score=134.81 TRINITY_DN18254_c0_g1_i1:80-2506(+)